MPSSGALKSLCGSRLAARCELNPANAAPLKLSRWSICVKCRESAHNKRFARSNLDKTFLSEASCSGLNVRRALGFRSSQGTVSKFYYLFIIEIVHNVQKNRQAKE